MISKEQYEQARQRALVYFREAKIALTPEEQLSFWNALNETPTLTPAQRRLASKMRGQQ